MLNTHSFQVVYNLCQLQTKTFRYVKFAKGKDNANGPMDLPCQVTFQSPFRALVFKESTGELVLFLDRIAGN